MFSKAGQLSVEMFALLQEKEAILHGKNKRLEHLEQFQIEQQEKLRKIKSEQKKLNVRPEKK